MHRRSLVALSQLAIVICTLLDIAEPSLGMVWPIAASAAVFIVLEWKTVPAGIRRTSLVLLAITIALLPIAHAPAAALERGIRIGGLIASLLLSVALLSRAAQRVPLLRQVISALLSVPAQQRFGTVTVAAQLFGGLLGFAGVAMMMEAASELPITSHEERVDCFGAISRGYAAANLWSPMFSNVSILLAVSPGLAWATVLPFALLLSLASLILGILVHRLSGRRRSDDVASEGGRRWAVLRKALPLLMGMLGFLLCVVFLSGVTHLPVAACIIALAPLVAWILNMKEGAHRRRPAEVARRMLADVDGLRSLVTEVTLLLASGCAGTMIASAIPATWTGPIASAVSPYPVLACLLLPTSVVLMSSASVHPLLAGILVATAFPAASMGLPPAAHLLAVLSGLALAVIVTPFSVMSLTASRFSGLPLWTVSVRTHLGFTVVKLLLVAAFLGGLSGYLAR